MDTFSIPCESWGSATQFHRGSVAQARILSVFPANRGVLRPVKRKVAQYYRRIFQYSLRIVGFCDGL